MKDLLKNQGFTIAGARKRLSEPTSGGPEEQPELDNGAKDMRKVLLGLRQDLLRCSRSSPLPSFLDTRRSPGDITGPFGGERIQWLKA